MKFYVIVDIEAPVRVDGEVVRHGRMAEDLRGLVDLGFRVDRCGQQESGAWDLDDIQVKCVQASAELSVKQFEQLIERLELETDAEEVSVMGGMYGFNSGPSLRFDGACRFSERHDVDDMSIVNAYVTPIPSFEPVNRAKDEDWMARSWERITRAIVARWGSYQAQRKWGVS